MTSGVSGEGITDNFFIFFKFFNFTHPTMYNQKNMEAPDWLMPTTPLAPIAHTATKSDREAVKTSLELTYEIFFENVLEKMCEGATLATIVQEDNRVPAIQLGHFRSWIHRDPKRLSRFYDARKISAEIVEDELITIADASTSTDFDDVARSKLRIDTRWKLLAVWDKKRFGETKQVEISSTHNINLRALLETRENRLNNLVIDQLPHDSNHRKSVVNLIENAESRSLP